MTMDEKLQFIVDRIKDEKEFYIGSKYETYRFRNFELRHVGQDRIEDYCPMSWNNLLSSPLKLKPRWIFTEDEKVILRNLPYGFQWIARDESNHVWVYSLKPTKTNQNWSSGWRLVTSLSGFSHLFKSIQCSDDEPCEFRRYL